MKPTIEIVVAPTGEILIEGVGFKGADCEKATRFLEIRRGKLVEVDSPDAFFDAQA